MPDAPSLQNLPKPQTAQIESAEDNSLTTSDKQNELTQLKSTVNDMTGQLKQFMSKGNDSVKDSKRVEKVNYLIAQIEGINGRLEGLERAIDLGVPIARAHESVEKLDSLSKNADTISDKMTSFVLTTKEMEKKMVELESMASQRASSDQIQALADRVNYLEKMLNELKNPKSKAIFTDIVSIEESLDKRVAGLESAYGEISNSPEAQSLKLVNASANAAASNGAVKPHKSAGLLDRLGSFFDGISGGLTKKQQ